MGYYSTLSGEITFSPPLNHRQIEHARSALIDGDCIDLRVDEDDEDTEQGILRVRTSNAIVPKTDEGFKIIGYPYLEDDLEALLSALPEGTEFEGYLQADGSSGECYRYFARAGRKLEVWKAMYIWPDGSTEIITH